jgi:hypothetical protein
VGSYEDFLIRVPRNNVLEEGDTELAEVGIWHRADRPHGSGSKAQLEIRVLGLAALDRRIAGADVKAPLAGYISVGHGNLGTLTQQAGRLARHRADEHETRQHHIRGLAFSLPGSLG